MNGIVYKYSSNLCSEIWITFSALVIDCSIPFAMFSRLLLVSVMLNIVLGRKVSLSSSQRVDIIFDIVLGGTLASYRALTWKSIIHIEYIPVAMILKLTNFRSLFCRSFSSSVVVEWLSLGWKLCWWELSQCRYHLFFHVRNIWILIGQVKSGVIAPLLTHLRTSFLFILACAPGLFSS